LVGTYTVTLIATNASGDSTPVTKTITVTAPPVVTPISSFTASDTAGTNPLSVTMTDTSTGTPTSWLWDLGDGTTSTLQNPSVTYTLVGTYTVTLTASNADGIGTVATEVITVTAPVPVIVAPVISGLSPANGAIGETVTITGTGFGTAGTVMFGTTLIDYVTSATGTIEVIAPDGIRRSKVTVTPSDGESAGVASTDRVIFKYDRIPRA